MIDTTKLDIMQKSFEKLNNPRSLEGVLATHFSPPLE